MSRPKFAFNSVLMPFATAFLLGAASWQLISQLPAFQISWTEHLAIPLRALTNPLLSAHAIEVLGWSLIGGVAILIAGYALLKQFGLSSAVLPLLSVRGAPGAKARGHQTQLLLDQTQAELDLQAQALLSLVGSYLNQSSDYSNAVAAVGVQLGSATHLGQVRSLIEALIARNSQAERDAEQLRGRLEGAQTQINAMRERLGTAEVLASVDPLTGIANRREFERMLDRQITKAHSTETPLCLVMVDIDHFKAVNDVHGHQMGDSVLKSFARALAQKVRSTDLVARYGGEEFAIVFPNLAPGNAFQIAERMRLAIESACLLEVDTGMRLVHVTASFGIAELREQERIRELIRRADQMLYEAKRSGRNRVLIESAATKVMGNIEPS